MKINENLIDKIVESIHKEDDSTSQKFADEQTVFLELLQTQQFPIMDEEARLMLFFITQVIYLSFDHAEEEQPEFDMDLYLECEDKNWAVAEANKQWEDALDYFFDGYPEEDLLAFTEDMLVEDEDQPPIRDTDKQLIFITAKSYIDQFIQS